jgi:hypothetical protein
VTAEPRLFTFDTTHHALWAESVALARGLGAEVVAAPAAARARCGLALRVLPEDEAALVAALAEEGVPCERYPPAGGGEPPAGGG